MNRFVKYGTIVGFLLILVGTGVSTAAFAMGGSMDRLNGWFRERFDSEFYGGYRWSGPREIFRDAQEAPRSGLSDYGGNWQGDFPAVEELRIQVLGGTIALVADLENSEGFRIEGRGGDIDRTSMHGDDGRRVLEAEIYEDEEMTLHIPRDWMLKKLEVDMDYGSFDGENLRVEQLELDSGDGMAVISQIDGKTAVLDCRYGQVIWSGSGADYAILEAETEGGKIHITLPEESPWGEFGGKFRCEIGTIETPEFSMSEMEKRRVNEDQRKRFIDAMASEGGQITIE